MKIVNLAEDLHREKRKDYTEKRCLFHTHMLSFYTENLPASLKKLAVVMASFSSRYLMDLNMPDTVLGPLMRYYFVLLLLHLHQREGQLAHQQITLPLKRWNVYS